MKSRSGFISNSSSTSFVLLGIELTPEDRATIGGEELQTELEKKREQLRARIANRQHALDLVVATADYVRAGHLQTEIAALTESMEDPDIDSREILQDKLEATGLSLAFVERRGGNKEFIGHMILAVSDDDGGTEFEQTDLDALTDSTIDELESLGLTPKKLFLITGTMPS